MICRYGRWQERYQHLFWCASMPYVDGHSEPVPEEILDEHEAVKAVLFRPMKRAGFHGEAQQRRMAVRLYPSLLERTLDAPW